MDSTTPKGFAIGSIVVGLFALIVAFIPCFGIAAFIAALIALALGGISLFLANRYNTEKTLALVGLIISGIATVVALMQVVF